MSVLFRILQLAIIVVLVTTVTGFVTMASAATDEPCCQDEGGDRPSAGADDCSPFCFSCPSRTVATVLSPVVPGGTVAVTCAAAPELTFSVPSDPPRRGVFHPPRPSLSIRSC